MSFAVAPKSKNKRSSKKTATPVKRSSHDNGVNVFAMTPHDSTIQLQKTIGNQAVQRLMRSNARNDANKTGIQTKLKVSQPSDAYEQEADRVAEQVMRMSISDSGTSVITTKEEGIDRKCSACEKKKEEEKKMDISRKPSYTSNLETTSKPASKINDVLSSSGSPLDPSTRQFFRTRLGYDFSNVRVHTDAQAAESTYEVNANAYTIGHNIVFGSGFFAPGTHVGRRLIAHELTHVAQQTIGKAGRAIHRDVKKASDDWEDKLEAMLPRVGLVESINRFSKLLEHFRQGALLREFVLKIEKNPEAVKFVKENGIDGIIALAVAVNGEIIDVSAAKVVLVGQEKRWLRSRHQGQSKKSWTRPDIEGGEKSFGRGALQSEKQFVKLYQAAVTRLHQVELFTELKSVG